MCSSDLVVMLNTGFRFDDHEDMSPALRERVHAIDHLMTPVDNLEVQTRVIQGADAYVGTYGGFSYVSPLAGTDTLTFYSHTSGFRFDHLELAKRVFAQHRRASYVELDVRSVELVRKGFTHPWQGEPLVGGARR